MPTTRPYADCLAQALALCGVPDSNAVEVARIGILLNRRAKQAYAESELWPRWLVVGEERIVSEDGLLPYEESGLQDIGTVLRIHESQPFVSDPAGEYTDWNAQSDGVQITGYVPAAAADQTSFTIDLSGTPYNTYSGDWIYQGNHGSLAFPYFSLFSGGARVGTLFVSDELLNPDIFASYENKWFFSAAWPSPSVSDLLLRTYESEPSATPDLVTTWTQMPGNDAYTVTFTDLATYSVFVTYKAALSTAYGTGEGEESDVPEEWFEFMATGGAGDFLCSDKETENGLLLKDEAQTDLDRQLAKISRQNGNKAATRVLTHGGMQAR